MKEEKVTKTGPDSRDTGTYQTGNTTPPRRGSPVTVVLLTAVIALGGLASALGIINIRLLRALNDRPQEPSVPIMLQPAVPGTDTESSCLETVPVNPGTAGAMVLHHTDRNGQSEALTEQERAAAADVSTVTVRSDDRGDCPGLILTADGYILTYAHSVAHAERIIVTLPDGTLHRACLVGYDGFSDLAVIYIRCGDLTPATFSDGQELLSGSKVTAFCGGQVSGGAVFASDTRLSIAGANLPLLMTSAANAESIGSVWNGNGQVIGLVTPRLQRFLHGEDTDIAYVMPAVTVKNIVDQLLSTGCVSGRPSLGTGVEEVTDVHQNYWKLPDGLRVTGSGNGELREGDILVQLAGREVDDFDSLYEILFSCQPGQTLQATVYRGNRTVQITIALHAQ